MATDTDNANWQKLPVSVKQETNAIMFYILNLIHFKQIY